MTKQPESQTAPCCPYVLGDLVFYERIIKRRWWQFWIPKQRTIREIYKVTHVQN